MSVRNGLHKLAHEQHKVPVTALEFCSGDILLAGEGTHLVAYSVAQKIRLGSTRIFRSQAIHRILINSTTPEIVVCGGSHVAFVKLQPNDGGLVTFVHLAQTDIGDWIFSAAFSPASGNDSVASVVLVTAHNALIKCTLSALQETKAPTHISTTTIVPGTNCVLYCAHISWLSASHCLVASGTAFGDVILWSSEAGRENQKDAVVRTHYIFQAHEGSVFDIQVSMPVPSGIVGGPRRLLATCSDDRTVRLWDVSDLTCESPSMTDIQRDTGFGSIDHLNSYAPPLLAKAAGHISRIWMVRFVFEEEEEEEGPTDCHRSSTVFLTLASFGEDGSCITWKMNTTVDHTGKSTYELQQHRVLPIHAGKNIWSSTIHQAIGASGGADGLIALLPSITDSSEAYEIKNELLSFSGEHRNSNRHDTFQSYTFVEAGTIVATTKQGHIITLTLHLDGTMTVERRGSHASLLAFSMTAGGSGLAFIAGVKGEVHMISSASKQCLPVMRLPGKVAGLFISESPDPAGLETETGTDLLVTTVGSATAQIVTIPKNLDPNDTDGRHITQLTLPHRFIVTSFVFVKYGNTRFAILGSRSGSLAVYSLPEMHSPEPLPSSQVLQHCHSKESITGMCFKAHHDSDECSGYLFSTGRDGSCAVHRIVSQRMSLSFELVHRLELPFGPNIEGLDFVENGSLRVWGFKSKKFVVHDVLAQQDVFTVECGGGVNRNWAYKASVNGGTFVWTQASTLMRVTQTELTLQTIRSGAHGREIKALAVSAGQHQIIATGAEDTDIKLFEYSSSSGFTCLQTLRKHNTGIQHLEWSADGSRLFSSAGSEEFYIWRVSHGVPVLGVGVICESSHPRSGSSDLRIMGFDVREHDLGAHQDATFDIIMAYSDSSVKSWLYSSGVWSLRQSGDYLTACLTDVKYLLPEQHEVSSPQRVLTTATDGHVAIWDTSAIETLSSTQRRNVHQNAILEANVTILLDGSALLVTGGDDNGIGLSRVSASNEISTLLIPRAHAAAVTALVVHKYGDDHFCVVSASIDQRVKMWDVRINTKDTGVEGLQVCKVQNVFTSVADVSSLSLLRLEDDAVGLLICGVGMDVWRFQPSSTPSDS